ncbi:MAG: RNA polymerase sigma factor SigZ [Chloroflexi bacterium]|nr:RNA polymerase sigma factor SigZ [Chloroflexota bacterium]
MLIETRTESIWNQFHVPLHAFIRQRVHDQGAADDLLQEVFLRVHTRIETLRDETKLNAWLYQITRNVISDYYRTHRLPAPLSEDLTENEADAQDALALQLAPSIREMVNTLPPVYREAFLLTEINGLSQVELARQLGISVSGAKSRVQRARAQIRQMLLDCCHFEFDRLGGVVNYYPRVDCCKRCERKT